MHVYIVRMAGPVPTSPESSTPLDGAPPSASPATSPYLMGRSAVFVNGVEELSPGAAGGAGVGGKTRRVSSDSDGWQIV